ncbi:Reverse transcriptase domain [Trinorchestia longiramus]|nr:Reverse transcriptase domain [Trinorchestia longiramus]
MSLVFLKRGTKKTPNNNCPIILTSLISKTIVRLLKVRITKHLDDQNLFTDTQHGFRRKHSCLTNLLDFFGEVDRIYDHAKAVNLVYLDFHKTFDKVPHERLMAKVETHGIQGNYSRWIRNWLTGRTERVMIHDQASIRRSNIRSPQGSVLGQLLFIIYNQGSPNYGPRAESGPRRQFTRPVDVELTSLPRFVVAPPTL